MKLTYGEMFAGYGGLGMGVQSVLGGEMAWCAEFDAAPSKILAHHWPTVPNLGDVTKVDWASVPKVDVITGGSPCQDLSHAGKRAGMKAGTRSGLWASMCDAIDIIRPRLVVWENVRGALSAEATSGVEPCPLCVGDGSGTTLRALGRVLGDLAELGYDARWYGLRAADVGAAHGRFRVFVFATPGDASSVGVEGLGAGGLEITQGLAGAGVSIGAGVDTGVPGQLTLLPTPAVNDMGAGKTVDARDAWTEAMQTKHGNGNGHGKSLAIEAQRLLPTPNTLNYKESGLCRDFGGDMTHALLCGCQGERSAAEHQADATEELRDVRSSARAQEVRRETGGLLGLHATETLQSDVWEHQGPGDEGRASLASPEASRGLLRDLLDHDRSSRSPQGPESREQRPVESGHAMQQLSPETALARGPRQEVGSGQNWGEYEAAIRRWEMALGRPAPAPTIGREADGKAQLSAAFCEWLMGLPAGHVTNPAIGISRNDQLKALGNGVVPQQAAAATAAFVHDVSQERAA